MNIPPQIWIGMQQNATIELGIKSKFYHPTLMYSCIGLGSTPGSAGIDYNASRLLRKAGLRIKDL